MRRRGITLLILLFAILVGMQNNLSFVQSKDNTIPQEAVRLRIIANSNTDEDQTLKLTVRDEVLTIVNPKVEEAADREEARLIIYDSLEEIRQAVQNVLDENNVDMDFTVDYGITPFPDKYYSDKLYPAGNYEAVLIVLGSGEGDNWWCVLFPPLCIVDISATDGVTYVEDTSVQYKFLIVEKIKELFGYK